MCTHGPQQPELRQKQAVGGRKVGLEVTISFISGFTHLQLPTPCSWFPIVWLPPPIQAPPFCMPHPCLIPRAPCPTYAVCPVVQKYVIQHEPFLITFFCCCFPPPFCLTSTLIASVCLLMFSICLQLRSLTCLQTRAGLHSQGV